MRRAQVAAIRRVQQTSRSIQARRAENGADRYGHQPFFGLRYDFGIGRRDRATSKVSSRAYRRLTEPSAVAYRCWASVDEEYRPKRVVQRFFLFWRHGCSADRNSPREWLGPFCVHGPRRTNIWRKRTNLRTWAGLLDHSVKATADVVYWHFASNEQCAPDVGKSGDKRTRGRLQIDVIMRPAGGRVDCTKIRAG